MAFSRQRLKPEIQCVSAESPQQCMERIQVGAGSRGQIRPGGQAVAVPGMVLTGPPSAYLVWRIQGSLSRRKSPMTIPQREGRRKLPQEAATTPWRGVGERQGEGGYFPWGSLRDSSLLSRWSGAEGPWDWPSLALMTLWPWSSPFPFLSLSFLLCTSMGGIGSSFIKLQCNQKYILHHSLAHKKVFFQK